MRLLVFLALVIAVSSCTPIYVPTVRNTPMFRGEGEFQGTVALSTGVSLQGAYAISDHVGMIGSYSILNEKANDPQSSSEKFTRKSNQLEVGLGYFNTTRSRRFELYGGYGQGESTTTGQYIFLGLGAQDVIVTGRYRRYFIQPSVGTNRKNFNLIFTPRLSFVDFYEFTSGTITEPSGESIHIFIEPAVTGKFRLTSSLDGMFQLGLNFPTASDNFFDYVPVQAALGVQLHLGGSLRTRVY